MKTLRFAPILIVLLVLASLAISRYGVSEESTIRKDLDFAQVGGQSLKLDLYVPDPIPDGQRRPPLVIWMHGGGWRKGSKDSCELWWLREEGYFVASISYRLTDKAIFPAQLHDCKAAIRWLRARADEIGFDPDKVVATGASAGGHLAALLGTTSDVPELEGTVGGNLDQSSRVAAVVDYYGATDFVLRSRTQPHRANKEGSVVYLLLGGGADKKVELAKQASAAYHVSEGDPPLLAFHGAHDKTVLLDQSQRIAEVYRKAGLPVTLHVLEESGHGGKEFYRGENRERVLRFLRQHVGP